MTILLLSTVTLTQQSIYVQPRIPQTQSSVKFAKKSKCKDFKAAYLKPKKYCLSRISHRRTHGLQTYIRRQWLIASVNLGYQFNVHAGLPLCVAMSQHCEEPGCSFQTMEGRSLIGYYAALFNALTSRFA